MAENKITLKLLVDTKANKVLFSEAGKDFVDFLIQIMSLPVGTVVKLLSAKKMVGCLGDLYKSIDALDANYLEPSFDLGSLLKSSAAVKVPLLSLNVVDTPTIRKFYRCSHHNHSFTYVTDGAGVTCPNCGRTMSYEITYVAPEGTVNATASSSRTTGCVKGVVTYMVMDNLEVKPMSTISGITLINKFHVKDVSSLVETEVQIGLKEGLAILKASLQTRDVLTTVFLGKKI